MTPEEAADQAAQFMTGADLAWLAQRNEHIRQLREAERQRDEAQERVAALEERNVELSAKRDEWRDRAEERREEVAALEANVRTLVASEAEARREAAEMHAYARGSYDNWRAKYDASEAARARLVEALSELTEDGPCRLDHHGYCQDHPGGLQSRCATKHAQDVLRAELADDVDRGECTLAGSPAAAPPRGPRDETVPPPGFVSVSRRGDGVLCCKREGWNSTWTLGKSWAQYDSEHGYAPVAAAPELPRGAAQDDLAERIEQKMHGLRDAPTSVRLRVLRSLIADAGPPAVDPAPDWETLYKEQCALREGYYNDLADAEEELARFRAGTPVEAPACPDCNDTRMTHGPSECPRCVERDALGERISQNLFGMPYEAPGVWDAEQLIPGDVVRLTPEEYLRSDGDGKVCMALRNGKCVYIGEVE